MEAGRGQNFQTEFFVKTFILIFLAWIAYDIVMTTVVDDMLA